MKTLLVIVLVFSIQTQQDKPKQDDKPSAFKIVMDIFKGQIEKLKPRKLARKEIAWKGCLLDAYKEAKEKKKPVLIYAFGGDPVEGRC